MLCDIKVVYFYVLKIVKLVLVIILIDCLKVLSIFIDVEVRRLVGINFNNEFVFLNIKNFLGYVIGWDCVNRMC